MDFKETFVGGEPNIGMPDLLLMQYSNYFGLQAVAQTLGNCIVTGCVFSITSINYTTRKANWALSEGYAIINKELIKIDALAGTDLYLDDNVPAPNAGEYRMFLTKDVTYNSKGTKTFNDGTSHTTWRETREAISFNGYLATPAVDELEIAVFNYNYGGSGSYTVTISNTDPIESIASAEASTLIAENNTAKFGTLNANTHVQTDGTGKLISKNVINEPGDISAYHYSIDDFTLDGNYHTFDLSSIVGAVKRMVLVRFSTFTDQSSWTNWWIRMKTNGNTNNYNIAEINNSVQNSYQHKEFWVQTDSSGRIEYNIEGWTTGTNAIYVTIGAWI